MKTILLLILSLTTLLGIQAQPIFTNPITGTIPGSANPYTTGQTVAPNITVSGIGRGSGITGVEAINRYNATGWNIAGLDANDYFTFTLSPNPGYVIDFGNFVYTAETSGTGPTNFSFRSSLDGFVSNIGTATSTGTTIDLTALAFQNRTSAVEFRLYAWGGSDGEFSINSFTFNGVVAACAPTIPPSGFSISNITTTSIEVGWTNSGNGDNVIVIGRIGSPVNFVPVNGVVYNLGQQVGDGNFVMYKGLTFGTQLNDLFPGTNYHFAVYAFNSEIPCYNTTALTGSATTPCNASNVTGLSGNCGNTTAAPAWTHAICYDEYIVVAKEGSPVSGTPSGDGTNYSANLNYGDGDAFGGGFIVYKGSGTNTGGNITGLNIGVTYYFKVFSRKDLTWSTGAETNCSPAIPTVNTDFFRSNTSSGNWTNISSWQSSSDGILWSNASAVPTPSASGVSIRNGHNITISASRTILRTTVETGGTLTISGGTLTLDDDGTNEHDLIIFGTVRHLSALWVIDADATWIIHDGATYIHETNTGITSSLDKATVSPNSNFIYRNTDNVALPGRTYGNLAFENTTLIIITATASGAGDITILGDLRIGTLYRINNNSSFNWIINGDLRIEGSFNISNNPGNKLVYLRGNLIVSTGATLFENNTGVATIIFDGEEEQSITISGTIQNEINFTIDNPEGVEILSNVTLPFNLNLIQGKISLNNFNLQITGALNGVSATRYIRTNGTGEYRQLVTDAPLLYPIGNSTYNPLILTLSEESALLGARVLDTVYSAGLTGTPFTDRVVNRLWDINGDLDGAELTLTVQWNEDEELVNFDRMNSYISHFINGLWDPASPSEASGDDPYTHTRSGITALSPFGVGSGGALPVNLLTFQVAAVKNNQLLSWTYETPERFGYFEVEHSRNGRNFNALGRVAEGELSSRSFKANYTHLRPGAGIHYYRLKMVDLDGSFKHSHVIQGRMDGNGTVRPLSTFISSEGFNVNVETTVNVLELRLADQLGRTIYQSLQAAESGVINIPLSNLSAGIYFLQVNADGNMETHKLLR